VDVTRQRKIEKALFQAEQAEASLRTENENLKKQFTDKGRGFIGESAGIRRLGALISTLAETDTPILITGETGTGKDLAAGAVHAQSRRSAQPFVKVDCASLPPTLLEAELFGYEKGAFTGANERKIGRFETAGEGTVFLDEIGNLDVALQAKLLRVLQDREFERLGGTQPIPVKARFISATNANLAERMHNGQFREDLYFRINGITLELPPLRDHTDDIPLLFSYLLQDACQANNKPVPKISTESLDALTRYFWPGNVRELKHCAEYIAVLGNQEWVNPADLPASVRKPVKAAVIHESPVPGGTERVLPGSLSKTQVKEALGKCHGNIKKAAVELGIGRGSMYRLLEQFKMMKK
jgi:DNA-binding NtrC family response regulator